MRNLIATSAIAFALVSPAIAQQTLTNPTDRVTLSTEAGTFYVNTNALDAELASMTPEERQAFSDADEATRLSILADRGVKLTQGL